MTWLAYGQPAGETYRVLYRIREDPREVIVLRVEQRRDAYRPL
jgi:mRNA-degrading endonuclease RelE of RelBE toxin-antitoxin system